MVAKLRSEDGFGVLELAIAIVLLNVGLLAIFAAFDSSAVAVRQASRVSTAAMLAGDQLERYHALTYGAIYLDTAAVAATDATYRGDTAYGGGALVTAS